jgi:hypothetical protein
MMKDSLALHRSTSAPRAAVRTRDQLEMARLNECGASEREKSGRKAHLEPSRRPCPTLNYFYCSDHPLLLQRSCPRRGERPFDLKSGRASDTLRSTAGSSHGRGQSYSICFPDTSCYPSTGEKGRNGTHG